MLARGDRDQGQVANLHHWHMWSTCLGMGNDDWEVPTARYHLGQHITHPDHGSTGQSPVAGPRGLNPPSVHLWVNQSMCLSWFSLTFDWDKSAQASDAVGEIPPAPCRELPLVALVMSSDMNTYMGGASCSQGICWTKPISDQWVVGLAREPFKLALPTLRTQSHHPANSSQLTAQFSFSGFNRGAWPKTVEDTPTFLIHIVGGQVSHSSCSCR